MKDYSELENKEVEWVSLYADEIGVVAFIDYDIGITVVDKENKFIELCCLNGKLSPNKEDYNEKAYKSFFNAAVGMIRKGRCNSNTLSDVWELKALGHRYCGGGKMARCAFN